MTVNIDFSGVKLTGLKETVNAIRSNPEQLTTNYVTSRKLEAPISAGEELGVITYQYNGATVFTAPLIASHDVAEAATILDNTSSPNSSPLIVSAGEPEEDGGSGWLFWVLLIALLIVIVIFAKIVSARRRRRRAKKRRAYRSKYPTRRQ